MPRPLLHTPKQETENKSENKAHSLLSAVRDSKQEKKTQNMDPIMLDRMLRKKRSEKYMQMIGHLDVGGHVQNREKVNEILDGIREEFPEVQLDGFFLGIVSVCYLGAPYEVHALDLAGGILEHYRRGEAMPGGLERARGLALRGGYEFIEVYENCCRAVSKNGTVSVISK